MAETHQNATRSRVLVGLVLVIAGTIAGWWVLIRVPPAGPVEWQGYAEADFVKVGPTQQGLITAVHVSRGDKIAQGAPLFDQDDAFDADGVTQAARQLAQAQDQLANLKSPAKPTEIAEAQANLNDAEAARDKVEADLERNQKLLLVGGTTAQIVNDEQHDLRSAVSKVEGLKAALALAQSSLGREGEIQTQTAAIAAAKAALAMAEWRVQQRHVVAPVSGSVADVLARPGETLAASAPVVSILPPANIFVRFFIAEAELPHVHQGDAVTLTCDTCPPDLAATISFIAPEAEFTPPVIYSESTRGKLVFMVEAQPRPDGARLLNPGQPMTVRPKNQDARP